VDPSSKAFVEEANKYLPAGQVASVFQNLDPGKTKAEIDFIMAVGTNTVIGGGAGRSAVFGRANTNSILEDTHVLQPMEESNTEDSFDVNELVDVRRFMNNINSLFLHKSGHYCSEVDLEELQKLIPAEGTRRGGGVQKKTEARPAGSGAAAAAAADDDDDGGAGAKPNLRGDGGDGGEQGSRSAEQQTGSGAEPGSGTEEGNTEGNTEGNAERPATETGEGKAAAAAEANQNGVEVGHAAASGEGEATAAGGAAAGAAVAAGAGGAAVAGGAGGAAGDNEAKTAVLPPVPGGGDYGERKPHKTGQSSAIADESHPDVQFSSAAGTVPGASNDNDNYVDTTQLTSASDSEESIA